MQIRINAELIKRIDALVKIGVYVNCSDVICDVVRRFVREKEVGTISRKGDSVSLVKKARKELSRGKIDLGDVNNL